MLKKSISLEEQKNIELGIMDAFVEYCNKNNLRYYMEGGTLLGAVRHKGFIPWDDDIDVSMPRKDYDELLKHFNDGRDDSLKLIWYGNTKGYHLSSAKIIDTRTKIIEIASSFSNIVEYGIYIDIFPLDVCPNSLFKTKLIWKTESFLSQLVFCKILTNKDRQKWYSKIYFSIIKPISFCFSIEKLLKLKDKIATRYNNIYNPKKIAPLIIMWYGLGEIHDIDWYGKGIKLRFESRLYNAPEKFKKVLNSIYGDFMKLPPLEERTPAHTSEVYWIIDKKDINL